MVVNNFDPDLWILCLAPINWFSLGNITKGVFNINIGTYVIPTPNIVHNTSVDFSHRKVQKQIHLVQYDKELPIIAVSMFIGGEKYSLPINMDVRVRFGKRDGTFIYKPVLGCDEERCIVYFNVDDQMTLISGPVDPILELFLKDGENEFKAGSSPIPITIDRNPIQIGDMESESKYWDIDTVLEETKLALIDVQTTINNVEQVIENVEDAIENMPNLRAIYIQQNVPEQINDGDLWYDTNE